SKKTVASGTTIDPITGEITEPLAAVDAPNTTTESDDAASASNGGCDAGAAGILALLVAAAISRKRAGRV
ncbi:MAG: hypothetical protein LBT08_04795, partial [Synergistaceae bacterium]|nr:hypothetical protein [Synergistaceae bacterium]